MNATREIVLTSLPDDDTAAPLERSPGSAGAAPVPAQATSDEQVLRLWLHGKAPGTRRGYERDTREFFDRLTSIYKVSPFPLHRVRLGDIQRYSAELEERISEPSGRPLAPATRARKLTVIKSLFSFAHEIGYLPFNVGKAIRPPKVRRRLAQRILSESEVHRLLAASPGSSLLALRNRVLLRLFYASSGRVSELSRLVWDEVMGREVPGRGMCGQVSLFGKGEKERSVLVSPETWYDLMELKERLEAKGQALGTDPVFPSRKRNRETGRPGHLDPSQVWRIVRAAARQAGLKKLPSPHWLRHAHISHALDRGAPVHQVRETAGHASLATTTAYAHARPGDSSGLYLPI